jgi:hypothetical protein
MDATQQALESLFLRWEKRRVEAVRLHNACGEFGDEVRELLWQQVKLYESVASDIRGVIGVHIANTERHAPSGAR